MTNLQILLHHFHPASWIILPILSRTSLGRKDPTKLPLVQQLGWTFLTSLTRGNQGNRWEDTREQQDGHTVWLPKKIDQGILISMNFEENILGDCGTATLRKVRWTTINNSTQEMKHVQPHLAFQWTLSIDEKCPPFQATNPSKPSNPSSSTSTSYLAHFFPWISVRSNLKPAPLDLINLVTACCMSFFVGSGRSVWKSTSVLSMRQRELDLSLLAKTWSQCISMQMSDVFYHMCFCACAARLLVCRSFLERAIVATAALTLEARKGVKMSPTVGGSEIRRSPPGMQKNTCENTGCSPYWCRIPSINSQGALSILGPLAIQAWSIPST